MTREEFMDIVYSELHSDGDNCRANRIIDAADEYAEEYAEEQTRWIPVSERLPNHDEYIKNNGLFNVSDGSRSYSEWFDIYEKKRFGEPTITGFRVDYAVTAWMPLPTPPNKSEIQTLTERLSVEMQCVLCKIRSEIEQEYKVESAHPYGQGLRRALEIIDRYTAEGSEE